MVSVPMLFSSKPSEFTLQVFSVSCLFLINELNNLYFQMCWKSVGFTIIVLISDYLSASLDCHCSFQFYVQLHVKLCSETI